MLTIIDLTSGIYCQSQRKAQKKEITLLKAENKSTQDWKNRKKTKLNKNR